MTFCPLRSASEIVAPVWLLHVKGGAGEPTAGAGIFVKRTKRKVQKLDNAQSMHEYARKFIQKTKTVLGLSELYNSFGRVEKRL